MPRKRSIIDDLFRFLLRAHPAIGPVLACMLFLLIRYAVPFALTPAAGSAPAVNSTANVLIHFTQKAAPFAAALVLFVWAFALLHRLFDSGQSGAVHDLDAIRKLSWQQFESLLADHFRRQGYEVEHDANSTKPDGGIDLRLRRDDQLTLVQCKHWHAWQVGVKPLRELHGLVAAQHAALGILVTSGDFSEAARREFADNRTIRLVDGSALEQMLRGAPGAGDRPD
jgi:restriction system protein